jgi:predicted O-methyltransferase YrrM
MEIIILIGIILVAATCLLVVRKVIKIHLMLYSIREEVSDLKVHLSTESVNVFRQLQVLPDLARELELPNGLPQMRGWAASPDFLLVISRHARKTAPDGILECGSGASTVVLARCLALQGNGHLYSLENDPEFAAQTRRRLGELGLETWATIIDAPLTCHRLNDRDWSWYSTDDLPDRQFDLIVVDGPPMSVGKLARYPAGPLLLPKLSTGGHCFLDDALREDEKEIVQRWMKEVPGLERENYDCEKGCVAIIRA